MAEQQKVSPGRIVQYVNEAGMPRPAMVVLVWSYDTQDICLNVFTVRGVEVVMNATPVEDGKAGWRWPR